MNGTSGWRYIPVPRPLSAWWVFKVGHSLTRYCIASSWPRCYPEVHSHIHQLFQGEQLRQSIQRKRTYSSKITFVPSPAIHHILSAAQCRDITKTTSHHITSTRTFLYQNTHMLNVVPCATLNRIQYPQSQVSRPNLIFHFTQYP